jgi:hypothetical protein
LARRTATLRDLIEGLGPALPPPLALEVARGLLARAVAGPFDLPPRPPAPEEIFIEERGAALLVTCPGPLDLACVGALLYEMLAGGPLRRPKDPPGARPRPLADLREFLSGGPRLLPEVVAFVERLLGIHAAGPFPDAGAAIDALLALGPPHAADSAGSGLPRTDGPPRVE